MEHNTQKKLENPNLVHPVKEKMYSKEELKQKMRDSIAYTLLNTDNTLDEYSKFIEQHLQTYYFCMSIL